MVVSVVGAGNPSDERGSRLASAQGAATEKRETGAKTRRTPQSLAFRLGMADPPRVAICQRSLYRDAGPDYAIGGNRTKYVRVNPIRLAGAVERTSSGARGQRDIIIWFSRFDDQEFLKLVSRRPLLVSLASVAALAAGCATVREPSSPLAPVRVTAFSAIKPGTAAAGVGVLGA